MSRKPRRRSLWRYTLLSAIFIATGCLLPFPRTFTGWAPKPEGGVPFETESDHANVNSMRNLCVPGPELAARYRTCFVADGIGFRVDSPSVDQCRVTRATCPIVFEVYFEGADSFCPTTKPITSCRPVPAGTFCDCSLRCNSQVRETLEEGGQSGTAQGQAEYSQFLKGGTLKFSFDRPYDPNAHYRLAITGVSIHGQAVKVPAIDFEPFRETKMDM